MQRIPRHKVFLSFHHAGDGTYKELFVRTFADVLVDHSVRTGDIAENVTTEYVRQQIRDRHIRDATVTIVLVGRETWKRKHVDWEIDASLRHTAANPRNGLMGILLPSYDIPEAVRRQLPQPVTGARQYWPNNIPPRLWDNIRPGVEFATMQPWPRSSEELAAWIHQAFERRMRDPPPDSSRDRFGQNRPADQEGW